MKRKLIQSSILFLSLPMTVFSLGMGDLKVNSYLNQPFKAEIVLTDVNIPLSGIKVSVASFEDFERIGFTYNEDLTLLKFKLVKDKKGQTLLLISSLERISDPYLELIIDMAWADGQLYRAYTVLLDPPDYKLATKGRTFQTVKAYSRHTRSRGVVDKPVFQDVVVQSPLNTPDRPASFYGPTLGTETIWAIAQRYVAGSVNVQQVALAIVGSNPQAFKDDNLNGLLAGKRLKIPATKDIANIPADLAVKEVAAHDRAWADQTSIQHAIKPPYLDGIPAHLLQQPVLEPLKPSHVPVVEAPKSPESPDAKAMDLAPAADKPVEPAPVSQSESAGLFPSIHSPEDILPALAGKSKIPSAGKTETVVKPSTEHQQPNQSNPLPLERQGNIQPGATNADPNAKIAALEKANTHLEQRMAERDKELLLLRQQMEVLLKQRSGVAGQSTAINTDEAGFPWLMLMVLMLLVGAGAGALFYFYQRRYGMVSPMPLGHEDQKEQPDTEVNVFEDNTDEIQTESTTDSNESPVQHEKNSVIEPKDQTGLSDEEMKSTPDDTAATRADSSMDTQDDIDIHQEVEDEANTQTLVSEQGAPVEAPASDILPPQEPVAETSPVPADVSIKNDTDISTSVIDSNKEEHTSKTKRPLADLGGLGLGVAAASAATKSTETQEIADENNRLNIDSTGMKPSENDKSDSVKDTDTDSNALDFSADDVSALLCKAKKESNAEPEQTQKQGNEIELENEPPAADLSIKKDTIESTDAGFTPQKDDDSIIDFDMEAAFNDPSENELMIEEDTEVIPLPMDLDITTPPETGSPLKTDEPDQSKPQSEDSVEDDSYINTFTDEEVVNEFSIEELNDEEPASLELEADSEPEPEPEPESPVKTDLKTDKPSRKSNKMVKSKAALDTLLSLSETYIGMGDIESAKQSLAEVIQYGNASQKKAAEALMKQFDEKD